MRILGCHIAGFGCFSEQDFSFRDGLNTILQDNGTGKTTLREFIAALFYGLSEEKEGALGKGRERWKPWQGGAFGGTLDVECGGKSYRISRTFGSKPKDDVLKVFDLSTRLLSEDLGETPGTALFRVDRGTFLKTVSVSGENMATSVDGKVHAKLGDLVEDTLDVNRFEAADAALNTRVNNLSDKRSTGEVSRLDTEITRLQTEIRPKATLEGQLGNVEENLAELLREKEKIERENREIARKQGILSAYQTAGELLARREELERAVADRKAEVSRAESALPLGVPSKDELAEIRELFSGAKAEERLLSEEKLSDVDKERFRAFREEFFQSEVFPDEEESILRLTGEITKTEDEVRRKRAELTELVEKETVPLTRAVKNLRITRWLGLGLFVLGLIAFALSFVLPAPSLRVMGIAVAVGGLFITALSFFSGKKLAERLQSAEERRSDLQSTLTESEKMLGTAQDRVKAFLERFGKAFRPEVAQMDVSAVLRDWEQYVRLKDTAGKAERLAESVADKKQKVRAFLLRYFADPGEDSETELAALAERTDRILNADEARRNAEKALRAFETEHDAELKNAPEKPAFPETLTELHDKAEELREAADGNRDVSDRYSKERDRISDLLETIGEKEEKISALQEKRAELSEELRITRLAKEYLEKAKESLSKQFSDPLSDRFRAYAAEILGEETTYSVDADGNAVFEAAGEFRKVDLLSAGYRKLTYLALRLALADLMYPKEKPVLFLDDPLTDLDEAKLGRAKELLRKAAETYQILYFTCHPSRAI